MPCYTIENSEIKVTASTNPELLGKALESLGYATSKRDGVLYARHPDGVTAAFRDGTLVVRNASGVDVDQNEIRRAYSAQVVMYAAKRFGWAVKQESPTKFQVTRRA